MMTETNPTTTASTRLGTTKMQLFAKRSRQNGLVAPTESIIPAKRYPTPKVVDLEKFETKSKKNPRKACNHNSVLIQQPQKRGRKGERDILIDFNVPLRRMKIFMTPRPACRREQFFEQSTEVDLDELTTEVSVFGTGNSKIISSGKVQKEVQNMDVAEAKETSTRSKNIAVSSKVSEALGQPNSVWQALAICGTYSTSAATSTRNKWLIPKFYK